MIAEMSLVLTKEVEKWPSSERREKTKEHKAFGEDMLNPSLIGLRPSTDKKKV